MLATIVAKMGVPPLSMPVTAELICCCASGNNVKGIATHSNESISMRLRSVASIFARAEGMRASVRAPKPTRPQVINPGAQSSNAMAMKRNDDPQIREIETNRAHSLALNAPVLVP